MATSEHRAGCGFYEALAAGLQRPGGACTCMSPQERIGCACPAYTTARECWRLRYDDDDGDPDDRCECVCHEAGDDDGDDE